MLWANDLNTEPQFLLQRNRSEKACPEGVLDTERIVGRAYLKIINLSVKAQQDHQVRKIQT